MSTDDRTWVAKGTTVTGTAPGRPKITYAPVKITGTGGARPPAMKDLRKVAGLLADALNADGEPPPLTTSEQAVLDVVLDHQAKHDYPAQMSKVCDLTGLKRPTVSNVFDRLVERGLGTRPPKNAPEGPVLHRPFVAHTPAVTR